MPGEEHVLVIVEGRTEILFVKEVLAPYCAARGLYLVPMQASKPGKPGGDVRFSRVRLDVQTGLKQGWRHVCTFVDYYGLSEWPGMENLPSNATPKQISDSLNQAAIGELDRELDGQLRVQGRYVPFLAVHEFEALLFSDPGILAEELGVARAEIEAAMMGCASPEYVNNSRETAPSKRLTRWKQNYKKTVTGITIAKRIGVETMRAKCPLFHEWLCKLGV